MPQLDALQIEIGAMKVVLAALLKHGFIAQPNASGNLSKVIMEIVEHMELPNMPAEQRNTMKQAVEDAAHQMIAFAVNAAKKTADHTANPQ